MKAAYIFLFSIYISRNQYHKSVWHISRFTDFKHVLPVSVDDHEGQLVELYGPHDPPHCLSAHVDNH